MPFKKKFFGGFEFTGKLKAQMEAIGTWYKEDTQGRNVPYDHYWAYVGSWFTQAATMIWEEEGQTEHLRAIRACEMVAERNPSLKQMAYYDMMDYIVEHLDQSTLESFGHDARAFARRELGIAG